ncbi:MAG: hypothetical protein ACM3JH_01515 [Acidithiobacillales bacterium]
MSSTAPDSPRLFAPPRDRLLLFADDARVFQLAARLWEPAGGPAASPIWFFVSASAGPGPGPEGERSLVWTPDAEGWSVTLGACLDARIDLAAARVEATVSTGLLEEEPGLAARYLLEAPAAVLLSRRAWQVLHAGAVAGPRGAAVIRGGAGAGKSTLVAAAWSAGFSVLADESLLVAREDPDDLAATVRDLTLRPDAAALLGLEGRSRPAFSGGEPKRRIDLWASSSPAVRRARRAVSILLGDRERTPARLVPLDPEGFHAAFAAGEIPQERTAGDPDVIARAWGARDGCRLDGARDLAGALAALETLLL